MPIEPGRRFCFYPSSGNVSATPTTGKSSMKKAIKRLIELLVMRAPHSVKLLLVRAAASDADFSRHNGRVLISLFSAPAGVTGILGLGTAGMIVSAPNDITVHKQYLDNGDFAGQTLRRIETFFSARGETGTYIDIGANIGLTTIPVANKFPRVRCISFEPGPVNFKNLLTNIKLNCPDRQIEAHNKAIFKIKSNIELSLSDSNLGDHRIKTSHSGPPDPRQPARATVGIEAVPLDDFAPGLRTPLAIKIDTQGAEPFVVEGGRQVLGMAELIIMEWSPYHIRQLGGDPDVILDFIATTFESCEICEAEGGASEVMTTRDAATWLRQRFAEEAAADGTYYDLVLTDPLRRPAEQASPLREGA